MRSLGQPWTHREGDCEGASPLRQMDRCWVKARTRDVTWRDRWGRSCLLQLHYLESDKRENVMLTFPVQWQRMVREEISSMALWDSHQPRHYRMQFASLRHSVHGTGYRMAGGGDGGWGTMRKGLPSLKQTLAVPLTYIPCNNCVRAQNIYEFHW